MRKKPANITRREEKIGLKSSEEGKGLAEKAGAHRREYLRLVEDKGEGDERRTEESIVPWGSESQKTRT